MQESRKHASKQNRREKPQSAENVRCIGYMCVVVVRAIVSFATDTFEMCTMDLVVLKGGLINPWDSEKV